MKAVTIKKKKNIHYCAAQINPRVVLKLRYKEKFSCVCFQNMALAPEKQQECKFLKAITTLTSHCLKFSKWKDNEWGITSIPSPKLQKNSFISRMKTHSPNKLKNYYLKNLGNFRTTPSLSFVGIFCRVLTYVIVRTSLLPSVTKHLNTNIWECVTNPSSSQPNHILKN